MDIYADVDLSEYGLEGVTMRLLVNVTRGFRKQFIQASMEGGAGATWLDITKRILDLDEDAIDNLDPLVLSRLTIPFVGDDGKLIMPVVYRVWDKWISDRVKALASMA